MARKISTVAIAVACAVSSLAAQVAPGDIATFMGTWAVMLDTPQGTFEQSVVFKDEAGKAVAELSSQIQPEVTTVTDIAKQGNDVILKFDGNFQGNAFDAMITMSPDGDGKAKVVFDVNGGQFSMTGTGTKK
jgi:hypothetical protein